MRRIFRAGLLGSALLLVHCGRDDEPSPVVVDAGRDAYVSLDAAVSAHDAARSIDAAIAPDDATTDHEDAAALVDAAPSGDASPPASTQIVANFFDPKQAIDGFGAAESFLPTITDAQADLFFSTTNGIGLSILRLGIAPTGALYSGSFGTAQKALARNGSIKVWGAPLSPPASAKTTGSTTSGSLLTTSYAAWVSTLASFVTTARANGVPVSLISAQNEPDFDTSNAYDMCLYDAAQMTSFVDALGPALAALTPPATVMMPESAHWGDLWSGSDYVDALTSDPTAASYVSVIASHQYGVPDPPAHAVPSGERFWETEMSDFGAFDPSIANAVMTATWIHDAMIDPEVNAWHYWWLVGLNADNEGLIGHGGDGTMTKRVYALGNFSRFVRPGWVRVGTSGTATGLLVTAYADQANGDFAIVAINTTSQSVTATFGVAGPIVSSVTPYVTSGTAVGDIGTDGNLSEGVAIAASMNAFSATIAPGIVTFVGQGR